MIIVRVGLGLTSDAAGLNHKVPSLLPSSAQRSSGRRRIGTDTLAGLDVMEVQGTKINTQEYSGTPRTLGEDSYPLSSIGDEKAQGDSVLASEVC